MFTWYTGDVSCCFQLVLCFSLGAISDIRLWFDQIREPQSASRQEIQALKLWFSKNFL